MAKGTFKKYFSINLSLYFTVLAIILGIVVGLVVRNYLIKKEKNYYDNKLSVFSIEIKNKVILNQDKLFTLGNILKSQINVPRVYFQIDKLMKDELLNSPYFEKIFIILNKNSSVNDTLFYNSIDSLGRINLSWYKNEKGLILTENYPSAENEFFYQTIALNPKTQILRNKNSTIKSLSQTIVIPLIQGNTFLGIIGIQINSNFLNFLIGSDELSKNIFLIDNEGIIIYTRLKDNIEGKDFLKLLPEFEKYEQDIIKENYLHAKSKDKYLLYNTLSTSNFEIPWQIGLLINKKLVYREANFWFIIILLLAVLISVFYYFFISHYLDRLGIFMTSFVKISDKLKNGIINEKFEIYSNFDEMEVLSHNFEHIRERFVNITEILTQIRDQKITQSFVSKNTKDKLAVTLSETIDAIIKRQIKREEIENEKQKEEWINEGLNKIHEASKIEKTSLSNLANVLNDTLCSYSDAFISIVYLSKEKDKKQILESVSTIGLSDEKAFKKEIEFGDGVVGAVALERKMIHYDKIPDDYYIVVSGLSQMKPKSILILPLIYEQDLLGVIEIAFFKLLKDFELKFFELASAEIALSFKNILNTEQTNELLEKMKEKNMQIEKTQRELESKIKELKKKETETALKETELEALINAVNNTLLTIEYTIDGTFVSANDKYLKTMHYSITDLKGKNVLDLVKSERSELENVIKKVSQGESFEKIMKRYTKYNEVRWLFSTYTPYYDSTGKITKILYFATDITETKQNIERLEKEISIMKKQIKLLRQKI